MNPAQQTPPPPPGAYPGAVAAPAEAPAHRVRRDCAGTSDGAACPHGVGGAPVHAVVGWKVSTPPEKGGGLSKSGLRCYRCQVLPHVPRPRTVGSIKLLC